MTFAVAADAASTSHSAVGSRKPWLVTSAPSLVASAAVTRSVSPAGRRRRVPIQRPSCQPKLSTTPATSSSSLTSTRCALAVTPPSPGSAIACPLPGTNTATGVARPAANSASSGSDTTLPAGKPCQSSPIASTTCPSTRPSIVDLPGRSSRSGAAFGRSRLYSEWR